MVIFYPINMTNATLLNTFRLRVSVLLVRVCTQMVLRPGTPNFFATFWSSQSSVEHKSVSTEPWSKWVAGQSAKWHSEPHLGKPPPASSNDDDGSIFNKPFKSLSELLLLLKFGLLGCLDSTFPSLFTSPSTWLRIDGESFIPLGPTSPSHRVDIPRLALHIAPAFCVTFPNIPCPDASLIWAGIRRPCEVFSKVDVFDEFGFDLVTETVCEVMSLQSSLSGFVLQAIRCPWIIPYHQSQPISSQSDFWLEKTWWVGFRLKWNGEDLRRAHVLFIWRDNTLLAAEAMKCSSTNTQFRRKTLYMVMKHSSSKVEFPTALHRWGSSLVPVLYSAKSEWFLQYNGVKKMFRVAMSLLEFSQ